MTDPRLNERRFSTRRRMFHIRCSATLPGALLCIAFAGCASVPQQELSVYQRAFDQAADASRQVLLDYQAAVREQRSREAERWREKASAGNDSGQAPGLFPATFSPRAAEVDVDAEDIDVRLRAVDTVQHYNQLLVDLAEGKSANETAATVKSLLGAIPGVGAAVPGLDELAASLVSVAGKARAHQDFVKIVKAGEQPVAKILDFLAQDAGSYYKLRFALASSDQDEIRDRLTSRVAAIKIEVRARTIQGDNQREALQTIEEDLNSLLARTGRLVDKGREQKLVPGSSGSPWNESVEGQLREILFAIEGDVKELEKLAQSMNAYHDLLSRYVEVLRSTKRAMGALRIAVDSPPDALQQIDQLATTTIQLRAQFLRFRENYR